MYPQRAVCTISSPAIQSHLIESHFFNNNFKDSKKPATSKSNTKHKHRARWKKDTSGRRTLKSRTKSKINKSKSSSKDRSKPAKAKATKTKAKAAKVQAKAPKDLPKRAKSISNTFKHRTSKGHATPNYVIHMTRLLENTPKKPDIHPQNAKHAKKKPIQRRWKGHITG